MKTYECLNPQCGHKWETDEEMVFECPKCHNSNFCEVGNDDSWIRKHKKLLLGCAIGAITLIILVISLPQSGTQVEVKKKTHSLIVTLTGEEAKNYSIRLSKIDKSYDKTKSNQEKTEFNNLYGGPYKLQITYIGNYQKPPKLGKYSNPYSFPPLENTNIPAITNVTNNPEKLSKSIKTYTITLSTDTTLVPLKQTEFSMDGEKWQAEPTFININPGSYIFYARNKKDKEAITETPLYEFEPYTPHIVTKDEVNALLKKLYEDDLDAASKLKRLCGARTLVTGLENNGITNVSGLCTYIVTEQVLLSCTITLDNNNPEIVKSINISK